MIRCDIRIKMTQGIYLYLQPRYIWQFLTTMLSDRLAACFIASELAVFSRFLSQMVVIRLLLLLPFVLSTESKLSGVTENNVISTTASTSELRISTDDRCGPVFQTRCPGQACCSSTNYCGTTSEHCRLGCQPLYGDCTDPSELPVSADNRCGAEFSTRCEENTCCSSLGHCGTTPDHCEAGCQSLFGKCNPISTPVSMPTISKNTPAEGEQCNAEANELCQNPENVCCKTHGNEFTTCQPVSMCRKRISSWAGTNHHFLYALPQAEQNEIIETFKQANVKVVRLFVSTVPNNYKFTNTERTIDIEHNYVGIYSEFTILERLDALLLKLYQARMKAIIALHDRYSLGAWGSDAYVHKYNLDLAGTGWDGKSNQSLAGFYGNAEATTFYDRRIATILTYPSKSFPGRTLRELLEVINSFNVQNEPMGSTTQRYPGWVCSRATFLKRFTRIPISTGGGADYAQSIDPEYFNCPALNHIGIHTTDLNLESAKKHLREAHNLAVAKGKKLVLEKVAAVNNKAAQMQPLLQYANQLGIPWLVWQAARPNNFWGHEFWKDDYKMWRVFVDEAASASRSPSIVAPFLFG